MTGNAMPTIETAPRDATALSQPGVGVFVHRRLAEQLQDMGFKIWNSEQEKAAFLTTTAAQRAAVIVHKLKEYDASRGIVPAATPAIVPPTILEAPAALAAPAEEGKRQPRTQATPAPATPTAGVQELLLAIGRLENKLDAVGTSVENLTRSVGINMASLNDVKAMLSASMKVQNVQLGLLCLFGQQVLGGVEIKDFVPAALEDADKALDILEKTGKG